MEASIDSTLTSGAHGIQSLLCELGDELGTDTTTSSQVAVPAADREVDLYKTLPKAYTNDILQWWQQHEGSFPILAKMAKKYLCVPATSVPSERQFSAAGNIVSAKRNSLKPGKVNQLCFLSANLKKYDM